MVTYSNNKLNNVPSSTSSHAKVDHGLHAFFSEGAHLVGKDGPRDDLVKWMVDEGNTTTTKHHCTVVYVTVDWDAMKSIRKLRELLQDKRYLKLALFFPWNMAHAHMTLLF
jgi:hypothetical protein